MSDPITDEMKKGVEELGEEIQQLLRERQEATEALININYEVKMSAFILDQILHKSAGNVGDLLRRIEQHLHTTQEHLGNVLGDIPGEEMEASNEQ